MPHLPILTSALAIVESRWHTEIQLSIERRVRWHACSPRNSSKQDLFAARSREFWGHLAISGLGFNPRKLPSRYMVLVAFETAR